MLILTRRIGESVYIGDDIRLTILGVRGTQVRLGINAPKEVPVHREEIYHRIQNETEADDDTTDSVEDADDDLDDEFEIDPDSEY